MSLISTGSSVMEIDYILSSFAIQNVNDLTKKIKFNLDNLTSSNTRTLTIPDADFTVVGMDTAQVLTNKYVDCLSNTVVNIADANVKNGANINVSKIGDGSVSNTTFSYINTLSSNAQTQINNHIASTSTHGVTGDIVGTSDVQVLTNKTLTDSLNYYQNAADNSKKVRFDTSNVSPSTTRVVMFPDASLTVAGLDTAQTLTNKTLDASQNTLSNIVDANIKSGASINASKIADGSVSNTVFQYISTLTSPPQSQINDHVNATSAHGVSGNLVGTSDTQTLSNKSFSSQVNMSNNKIVNLATPTADADAANKQYVDSVASGLDVKVSVRAATTGQLEKEESVKSVDYENPDAIIVEYDKTFVVDSVEISSGDRLLLKNQEDPTKNGIWDVKLVDGKAILTRSSDFNGKNVTSGSFTFVDGGFVNVGSGWVVTTQDPIEVGKTELAFTQFSGAGQIIAGDSLEKVGNQLNVVGSSTVISSPSGLHVNSSSVENQILLSSGSVGSSSTFGSLPLGNSNAVSGTLKVLNGGTGASSFDHASRVIATNSANDKLVVTNFSPEDLVGVNLEQKLSNKTLRDPIIDDRILDENENTIVELSKSSNAVNNLTISNASAGNGPSLSATGSDRDINLNLSAKGNGNVVLSGLKFPRSDPGIPNYFLKTDGLGNLSFATVSTTIESVITTNNGNQTTVATIGTSTNASYIIRATVIGRRTDLTTEASAYLLNSVFLNNNGTLTKVGGERNNFESNYAWDCNFSSSGTNVLIYVVGQSGKTINWKCVYTLIQV